MTDTICDQFIAALHKRGETIVKEIRKRTTMTRTGVSSCPYFYIGSHGSLRTGATFKGSIPCSIPFKAKLLEELKS